MNKELLRRGAFSWLMQAGSDLANRLNAKLANHEVSANDLVDIFDIDRDTLAAILNGDISNLSPNVIISLFIYNNLTLDVVEHRQSENNFSNGRQNRPTNNRPSPRSYWDRIPTSTNNVAGQGRAIPVMENNADANPYMNVSIDDLKNLIRQNLWDSEIDVDNSSKHSLAEFLLNKERAFTHRNNATAQNHAQLNHTNRGDARPNNVANQEQALNQMQHNITVERNNAVNQQPRHINDDEIRRQAQIAAMAAAQGRHHAEALQAQHHAENEMNDETDRAFNVDQTVNEIVKGATDFLRERPDLASKINEIAPKLMEAFNLR